jgi:signal transduction histidine kinase/DNA-binding response OmpR family regulator
MGDLPVKRIYENIFHVRVRYVISLAVMTLACLGFVLISYQHNRTFALTSEVADLWAELDAEMKRAGQLGLSLSEQPAQLESAKLTLGYRADQAEALLSRLDQLWPSLPADLQRSIQVMGSQPLELQRQFVAAARGAAQADVADLPNLGSSLFGQYGTLSWTFEQVSGALRAFHERLADDIARMNMVSAAIATVMILGLGFFIFLPMERAIARTIRDLDVTRERAVLADRAKSEFLANMSHEIRTPMNGVMGMAELLAKTELDAKQKTFTDIIVKSGNALLTIINDILDFSKIDAGQLELDPQPFKLAEAVEDVATLVSARVEEKELELAVRVQPDLPEWLVGDVGRFRQIVTNLVGNAVKFTDAGHVLVDVSGTVAGGTAELLVKVVDTGIGIPADKVGHVFEKFSQVDGSSTRKHEGTGLGLTISKLLVEKMGGAIGVESKVGEGSTFWFAIPLPVHGAKTRKKSVPGDVSGAKVLVVDDNEVNRSILLEQLDSWRFEAVAVSSGREGLAALRQAAGGRRPFELVILDYHMPGMDGAQTAQAIRDEERIAGTPIIMLTSVDQPGDAKQFRALAVAAYLVKPARSSLLLDTLVSALHEARQAGEPQGEAAETEKQPQPSLSSSGEAKALGPDPRGAEEPAIEGRAPASPGPSARRSALPEGDKQDGAASASQAERPGSPGPSSLPSDQVRGLPEGDKNIGAAPADEAEPALAILVAEDNEVNRLVVEQILADTGHSYALAENGEIALAMWRARQPALVLMDVSMPVMNGLEATRAIRAAEAEHGLPRTIIVGLTAHALKGDREMCIAAGMDDYMPKPISPDKLTAKIAEWLERSHAERKAA